MYAEEPISSGLTTCWSSSRKTPTLAAWNNSSIVFVIFAAVALKTKGLKIIESCRASLASWHNMVDLERSVF